MNNYFQVEFFYFWFRFMVWENFSFIRAQFFEGFTLIFQYLLLLPFFFSSKIINPKCFDLSIYFPLEIAGFLISSANFLISFISYRYIFINYLFLVKKYVLFVISSILTLSFVLRSVSPQLNSKVQYHSLTYIRFFFLGTCFTFPFSWTVFLSPSNQLQMFFSTIALVCQFLLALFPSNQP